MLASIMSDARKRAARESGMFKAGASEVLALYPVLRSFVERVVAPTGELLREVASFKSNV